MLRILDIISQCNADNFRIALRLAVSVQEVRVIQMRLVLAYITVVFINPPLIRSRYRTFVATCPLSEHTGSISVVLHDFRQDDMFRVVWMLTYPAEFLVHTHLYHRYITPVLLVATYFSMSRMLSSHERSTRRRTHRTTCIGLCKAHPFTGHTVQVRGVDILLTVTSQVVISQVIAHDVDDVGLLFFCLTTSCEQRKCSP